MSAYWKVILFSKPYGPLTYEVPRQLPQPVRGGRVVVPLGGGFRAGVYWEPCDKPEQGFRIKPVVWPLESVPLLQGAYLDMVRNLAARQTDHPGKVLDSILPRGLKTASVRFEFEADGGVRELGSREMLRLDAETRARLSDAFARGRMKVKPGKGGGRDDRCIFLEADPPWSVRPNAVRQNQLLEYLFDKGPQNVGLLNAMLGNWVGQTAKKLASMGLVRIGFAEDLDEVPDPSCACDKPTEVLVPSDEQRVALAALREGLSSEKGESRLVHGVTGSGKTFVYFELIRQCLDSGRSALLLAPEVALACKLWNEARDVFADDNRIFYHGYQPPSRREKGFVNAAGDGPVLAIGTRSSLFLPLRDPGLIILDEEHDESFKQDERMAYSAKEVAWFRVSQSGGLLVLGSATPDLKTYHAAREGHIPLQTMSSRVGKGRLPEMKLVDIGENRDPDVPFAQQTVDELTRTVEAGEQAIIMLNRRGFAPLMYCLDCGETVRCPECKVGMTYHKGRERLICHYCGFTHAWPLLCENCSGANFLPMGEGTERIEEVLRKMFPHEVGILRMDRDSARRQERMEAILEQFRRKEASILVGTQMLSKGHHFPDVTLVVVANGDLGLNLPDYRSAERTFQLLVQVAGRAGRGEKPGKVLVQTRNPAHPFWKFVLEGDYEGFYASELTKRRMFNYPPFVKLALFRLNYPMDWEQGGEAMGAVAQVIKTEAAKLGVTVLGPASAPLAVLRGRKRFQCLVKSADWPSVRTLFHHLRQANPAPGTLRISLDMDPVNML